jgi:hypothetical protein
MLKATIAATALFAAAGGGTLVGVPASARVTTDDSHTFTRSTSRSHNLGLRHYHRNRNWNSNGEDAINRIRLPINSTNTVTPTVNVSPVVVAPTAAA